jgi:hypothetical protein
VLVAVVRSKADWRRVRDDGWYRIPRDKAPACLLEGRVQRVAFYLPQQFEHDAWQVRWMAHLNGLHEARRCELLPAEERHPRANDV